MSVALLCLVSDCGHQNFHCPVWKNWWPSTWNPADTSFQQNCPNFQTTCFHWFSRLLKKSFHTFLVLTISITPAERNCMEFKPLHLLVEVFPFYSMYFHTSPCSQDLQTGGTEEPFALIAYMEYLKGCSQVMQRVVKLLSSTFLNVLEMVTKTWSVEMLLFQNLWNRG